MEIHINLKLFATLRRFLPRSAAHYPVPAGITIRDLIAGLGIPAKEAKLIFIDGVRGTLDSTLKGDERVGIFPPVGGG